MKDAMNALIKGLEMSGEAISLLGSTIQSQAKHIKALEDRIEALEQKLYKAGVIKE